MRRLAIDHDHLFCYANGFYANTTIDLGVSTWHHLACTYGDGKLIAFTSHDSTDDTHRETSLFVMSADGSGRRELTKGLDRSPLFTGVIKGVGHRY